MKLKHGKLLAMAKTRRIGFTEVLHLTVLTPHCKHDLKQENRIYKHLNI